LKKTFLIIIAALLILLCQSLFAQRQKKGDAAADPAFSSKVFVKPEVVPDSLELARRDSLHKADSIFKADSISILDKSSLEQPAFSAARDSIVQIFSNGQRIIQYYGDVNVKYGDMSLTAERMDYDMNTGIVHAFGVLDTLKGEWVGKPVMTQGNATYKMDDIRYNFDTKRASVKNMVTKEADGIMHGKTIKMMEDHSINVVNGKYTVCDLEHPHYYLAMTAAKVVTEPSRKTVFGPAYVVVEDVKIPFIGIPFGFVPKRPDRATGLLMPTFGEETARGFYIRDLGMYFVLGDYFDVSLTGSYFTLGSWGIDVNSRYKVNYKFNGNLSLTYSDDRTGEKGSADYNQQTNFALRWSHQQDSKAHPGSTFSASVNFTSPSNNRYNSRSVTEAIESQASSSISYTRNWNGKLNLSINALHSQNSRDSSYAFTLPNVSFSVSTFYPFKRKNIVGKERFYEKISFGYNTSLQNKVSFKAKEINDPDFGDKFQTGMNHNFSIGLPTFQLFKYITINPSVSYSQNWFFRASSAYYDEESNSVKLDNGSAFNHFGITQDGSASIAASTRLYGMFNFGKYHKIQAIRHVISPSLSANFSPEKGTYGNGYRTYTYTDKDGNQKEYEYNIYQGQFGSYPSKGKTASMALSIGNNIEAKVRDYADTTGKGSKKVKLIDQLSINTGYNFLAEQFKMSQISLSMSTSVLGKISFSGSAAFDPYGVNEKGTRINEWAVNLGQGLTRFTNASASVSYSISGQGKMNGNDGTKGGGNDGKGGIGGGGQSSNPADYYQRIYYHPTTGEYIPGGWLYYTNPDVPWSLNFSYSLAYTKNYAPNSKDNINQTLGINGNLKLTPKMNINFSTGFDFSAMNITTTQLSATYDLHCFNISISWVPFGKWQSYSFRIAANAAALADLLRYKKSSSFWDN